MVCAGGVCRRCVQAAQVFVGMRDRDDQRDIETNFKILNIMAVMFVLVLRYFALVVSGGCMFVVIHSELFLE